MKYSIFLKLCCCGTNYPYLIMLGSSRIVSFLSARLWEVPYSITACPHKKQLLLKSNDDENDRVLLDRLSCS